MGNTPRTATSSAAVFCLTAVLLTALCGCARRPPPQATLVCVGDVMLGRGVGDLCLEKGNAYPFERYAKRLAGADIAFCNLEAVLSDQPMTYPRVNPLRARPEMADALAAAGFDVVSLANNHVVDCGRPGLRQTMELLDAVGIAYTGAGRTLAEAEQRAIVEANGLRFGFLAFSDFAEVNFVHAPEREAILILSEETLRRTVPPLRDRCDVLVVSCHWGSEFVVPTTTRQRDLAHLAVDLGADILVGHHAHVRGEVEHYGDGSICYCLGDFIFDIFADTPGEGSLLEWRCTPGACELTRQVETHVADLWEG
ncbi:MAG TPA: hypothetical protein DGT21_03085 [Armatimonadetes bacterium]|nr:hypothetical protein [Armatimonadota bacterium]